MTGLVLLALARAAPTDAPGAPDPTGAPTPGPTDAPAAAPGPTAAPPPAPDPSVVPPVPLAPLVAPWPADVVAGADAAPVEITVEVVVDERGAVESARAVAGPGPFAAAAANALATLRFAPATDGGVPVAVVVPVRVTITPPPITVAGTLRDAAGTPLPGVTVTVAGREARTDDAGRFAYRGVPPGDHTLTVADPRFSVRAFTLAPDEAVTLDLALLPTIPGVVGTYRPPSTEPSRRALTAEEIRTLPGTMGDPLRAVSNLPGAARTPLDAGWLLVRGGDPRDTGVYVDGVRVPLVYHLGGFTSVVHPAFVDELAFYPGGTSARYGRATAGAVDLLTHPRPSAFEARAGANLVLAGAYAAVPIGPKGAVRAAFRRSYLDAVLAAVPGISEEQARVAPRFWDWQLRGDYGGIRVFGLGYVDTLDASTSGGQRAAVTIATHRVHGRADAEVLGKPLRVQPFFGWERYSLTLEVLDRVQVQEKLGGGLRLELADEGHGSLGWTAGVDAATDAVTLTYEDDRAGVVRAARIDTPDPYAGLRLGARDGPRGGVGLRVDTLLVTDQLPRAALSPRGSVTVPLGAHVTLLADAGVHHQPPPAEMLVGPPEGSALLLEQSWGGGLGARFAWGPWEAGVDGYGRSLPRVTAYEDDGSLGQIQGRAWGVETSLRYRDRRVNGWVTYTWARSERRDQAFDRWEPSAYDQPHTVVLIGAADLGRGWTLGGRWRYASGFALGRDEPVDAYDVLLDRVTTLDPSVRTDPFHALDVKIAKQARYRSWRLEYSLDLQNVYNRRVAEPVISGVWEAYGAQTYGFGLPILPILGVEAIVGG